MVLKGNGKHFQAGADLKWIDAVRTSAPEDNLRVSRATADAVQRLNFAPVPTIALVQGGCFGGGTGIIAACDVVIAADNALFSIAEVRWGLHASIIVPQLADAIGVRQLRRYALTGERFGAEEAFRIGLAHKVVRLAELEAEGARMVDHVLANGPDAIAETKAWVLRSAWGDLDETRRRRTGREPCEKTPVGRGRRGSRVVRREARRAVAKGLTAARSVLGSKKRASPGNADAAYRSPRRLAHLRHARGAVAGVQTASFDLEQSEFLCIVGPSGCGKSTLLNLIAGFLNPTGGEIRVGGKPVNGHGLDRGVVFQDFAQLFPWRTALGNVTFGLEMKGVAKAEREEIARKQLALVKLEKFCRPLSAPSLGRHAAARRDRARARLQSAVLLMDEPFAALDALTRDDMQRLLADVWRETRKTIVYVTHNVAEAVYLADRVIVMTPHPGTVKADDRHRAAAPARSAERGIPRLSKATVESSEGREARIRPARGAHKEEGDDTISRRHYLAASGALSPPLSRRARRSRRPRSARATRPTSGACRPITCCAPGCWRSAASSSRSSACPPATSPCSRWSPGRSTSAPMRGPR